MKNIIMVMFCLLLSGCHNMASSDNKLSEAEIKLKYVEMNDKLVEYGKLIYENEQWLNDDSTPIRTFSSLEDLFINNEYDISMFVNPKTGEKCDLKNSKIEFIITNVDDLKNIKYEFNPILICDDLDINTNIDNVDLYNILISYMADIYDNDEYMNGGLESNIYRLSLRELSKIGYDVSMFINSETNEQCDLDNSYGIFEIYGTTSDGKTDYVFGGNLDCE